MKHIVLALAVLAGAALFAGQAQAGQWGRGGYYRPVPAWGYPAYPSHHYGYGYPVYGYGYGYGYPVYGYVPSHGFHAGFGSTDPFGGSPNGGNYWYWLTRQYEQGRIPKSVYERKMYGNRN